MNALTAFITRLAAVILVGASISLNAQTPAQEKPTPEPAAQPAAQAAEAEQHAVPSHPSWHGSLSLGIGLAGGAQGQKGYQIDGSALRPFTNGGRFVASASRAYQRVTFPSESLLADRFAASGGFDQSVTTHTIAMVRSLYLRDKLLYVDSRFEQLAGYGLRLHPESKRWELLFIPGISVFKQDLSYSDIKDWEAGWGFYQKLSAKLNKAWSVENTFRLRDNFTDVDRSIEAAARINGMITRTLGLQLEYQYNHESIVPDGFPEYLQILSAGLRFQF
ncbi:MAG: DUF481 domain-containing protein [Acidobacteria bacterium]|nr:DUF481 domain-containing protein [Acidobacteriota bacterium]